MSVVLRRRLAAALHAPTVCTLPPDVYTNFREDAKWAAEVADLSPLNQRLLDLAEIELDWGAALDRRAWEDALNNQASALALAADSETIAAIKARLPERWPAGTPGGIGGQFKPLSGIIGDVREALNKEQTDNLGSLIDYMRMVRAVREQGVPPEVRSKAHYLGPEDLVLREGRVFHRFSAEDPKHDEYSTPGDCFRNAVQIAMRDPDRIYVEGFAFKPGTIPTQHAWTVDKHGDVYDPTWGHDPNTVYVGIPMRTGVVLRTVMRRGTYTVLTEEFEYGKPIPKSDLVDVGDPLPVERITPKPGASYRVEGSSVVESVLGVDTRRYSFPTAKLAEDALPKQQVMRAEMVLPTSEQDRSWDGFPLDARTGQRVNEKDTPPERTPDGDFVFYHGTSLQNAQSILKGRSVWPDDLRVVGITTTPSQAQTFAIMAQTRDNREADSGKLYHVSGVDTPVASEGLRPRSEFWQNRDQALQWAQNRAAITGVPQNVWEIDHPKVGVSHTPDPRGTSIVHSALPPSKLHLLLNGETGELTEKPGRSAPPAPGGVILRLVVDKNWLGQQSITREVGGSGRDQFLIQAPLAARRGQPLGQADWQGIPAAALKDVEVFDFDKYVEEQQQRRSKATVAVRPYLREGHPVGGYVRRTKPFYRFLRLPRSKGKELWDAIKTHLDAWDRHADHKPKRHTVSARLNEWLLQFGTLVPADMIQHGHNFLASVGVTDGADLYNLINNLESLFHFVATHGDVLIQAAQGIGLMSVEDEETKAQVAVRPYIREGHPVAGYSRELTEVASGAFDGILYPLEDSMLYMSRKPHTQLVERRDEDGEVTGATEQPFWKAIWFPENDEFKLWFPNRHGKPHHDDIRELYSKEHDYYHSDEGYNLSGYGPDFQLERKGGSLRDLTDAWAPASGDLEPLVEQFKYEMSANPSEWGYMEEPTDEELQKDAEDEVESRIRSWLRSFQSDMRDAVAMAQGGKFIEYATKARRIQVRPYMRGGRPVAGYVRELAAVLGDGWSFDHRDLPDPDFSEMSGPRAFPPQKMEVDAKELAATFHGLKKGNVRICIDRVLPSGTGVRLSGHFSTPTYETAFPNPQEGRNFMRGLFPFDIDVQAPRVPKVKVEWVEPDEHPAYMTQIPILYDVDRRRLVIGKGPSGHENLRDALGDWHPTGLEIMAIWKPDEQRVVVTDANDHSFGYPTPERTYVKPDDIPAEYVAALRGALHPNRVAYFDSETDTDRDLPPRPVQRVGGVIQINDIFLPPEEQSAGIGSAVVRYIEQYGRDHGQAQMTLTAAHTGAYAWARAGFDFTFPGPNAASVLGNDAQALLDDRNLENGIEIPDSVPATTITDFVGHFPSEQELTDAYDAFYADYTDEELDTISEEERAKYIDLFIPSYKFRHVLDIANFGRNYTWEHPEYGKLWLGKAYLIGQKWDGRKPILPEVSKSVAPDQVASIYDAYCRVMEAHDAPGIPVTPDGYGFFQDDDLFWDEYDKADAGTKSFDPFDNYRPGGHRARVRVEPYIREGHLVMGYWREFLAAADDERSPFIRRRAADGVVEAYEARSALDTANALLDHLRWDDRGEQLSPDKLSVMPEYQSAQAEVDRLERVTAESEKKLGGRVYRIDESQIPTAQKRVAALAKAAQKVGVDPPTMELVGEEYIEPWRANVPRGEGEQTHNVYVLIQGTEPKIAGWEFLARLQHLPNGQNLIMRVPGSDEDTDLTAYRDGVPKCDHCNTKRDRNDTFIVRNAEGRTQQVGRSCLRDFLGHGDPKQIISYLENWKKLDDLGSEEPDGERGTSPKRYIPTLAYLTHVATMLRSEGWTPRSAHTGLATADRARNNYFNWVNREKDRQGIPMWEEPTDEDRKRAEDALAWARETLGNKPNKTEFEHNMSALAEGEYLPDRGDGILAYVLVAHAKAQEREIEMRRRQETEAKSEHIGEVGQRLSLRLTVMNIWEREGNYGVTYITKLHDQDGNIVKWFGSYELEQGETYEGMWTIKKHDEFRGVKETVVTRPAKLEKVGETSGFREGAHPDMVLHEGERVHVGNRQGVVVRVNPQMRTSFVRFRAGEQPELVAFDRIDLVEPNKSIEDIESKARVRVHQYIREGHVVHSHWRTLIKRGLTAATDFLPMRNVPKKPLPDYPEQEGLRAIFYGRPRIGDEGSPAGDWLRKRHGAKTVQRVSEIIQELHGGQITDMPGDAPHGMTSLVQEVSQRTEVGKALLDLMALETAEAMKHPNQILYRAGRHGDAVESWTTESEGSTPTFMSDYTNRWWPDISRRVSSLVKEGYAVLYGYNADEGVMGESEVVLVNIRGIAAGERRMQWPKLSYGNRPRSPKNEDMVRAWLADLPDDQRAAVLFSGSTWPPGTGAKIEEAAKSASLADPVEDWDGVLLTEKKPLSSFIGTDNPKRGDKIHLRSGFVGEEVSPNETRIWLSDQERRLNESQYQQERDGKPTGKALFHITLPAGTPAAWHGGLWYVDPEAFEVTKVEEDKWGLKTIHVKYVGPLNPKIRTKTAVQVKPYLREGHLVAGYMREFTGLVSRDDVPEKVRKAFADLASLQRGEPEKAMRELQMVSGGGVISHAAEHVGDLNHRMNEWADERNHVGPIFGLEATAPKVRRMDDLLHNPYGFGREAEENLRANAPYQKLSVEQLRKARDEAMAVYADAHARLPVYNRAQYLAREAAVSLGRHEYARTADALDELRTLTEGDQEHYTQAVTDFRPNRKGDLMPYPWPEKSVKARVQVRPYIREGHPVAGYVRESPVDAVLSALGIHVVPPIPGPDVGIHSSGGFGVSELVRDQWPAGRQEGHFGTGIYFVSKPERLTGIYAEGGGEGRHVVGLDLSGKRLFRPQSHTAAFKLNDTFGDLHGLAFYGKKEDTFGSHITRKVSLDTITFDLHLMLGVSEAQLKPIVERAWQDMADRVKKMDGDHEFWSQGGGELASTQIMRALGYDGIDVRDIPEMDDTGWGSVLYAASPQATEGVGPKAVAELASRLDGMKVEFDQIGGSEGMPQILHYMTVADADGDRVAEIQYRPTAEGIHIDGIGVNQSMRGQGLAVGSLARLHQQFPEQPLVHGSFASLEGIRLGVFMAAAYPDWNKLWVGYDKTGDKVTPIWWKPGEPLTTFDWAKPLPQVMNQDWQGPEPTFGPLDFRLYPRVPETIRQALADVEKVRSGGKSFALADFFTKAQVQVRPYIREGHPVAGYTRDLIREGLDKKLRGYWFPPEGQFAFQSFEPVADSQPPHGAFFKALFGVDQKTGEEITRIWTTDYDGAPHHEDVAKRMRGFGIEFAEAAYGAGFGHKIVELYPYEDADFDKALFAIEGALRRHSNEMREAAELARDGQKARVQVRPYMREGHPVAGYVRVLPEALDSIKQAEDWLHSQGLAADLTGLEDHPDSVREITQAVAQVLHDFPQIRSNPTWRFGGVASYSSPLCPQAVRELGQDAWGAHRNVGHIDEEMAARMNREPRQGGPWVFINDDGFGRDNLLADIGFVTASTDFDSMIHELGHVVENCGVNRADQEDHTLLDSADLERIVRDAWDEVWNTPVLRKKAAKDISIYGMSPGEEGFAEAFVRLNSPGSLDKVPTKAGRARLLRFQKLVNERVNESLAAFGDVGGDYRGRHEAPDRETGAPMHNLSDMYPEDIYGPDGARIYGSGWDSGRDMQAWRTIVAARDKPDTKVRVYRAVPEGGEARLARLEREYRAWLRRNRWPTGTDTEGLSDSDYFGKITDEIKRGVTGEPPAEIQPGDWVTPTRAYAVQHGQSNLRGHFEIVSKLVRAGDLYTEANSLHEWGWDPPVKRGPGVRII